jgi:hypothetical protein
MTYLDNHESNRCRRGRQCGSGHSVKIDPYRWRQQLPGIRTLPTCANGLRTLVLDDETRGTSVGGPKEPRQIRTRNALL